MPDDIKPDDVDVEEQDSRLEDAPEITAPVDELEDDQEPLAPESDVSAFRKAAQQYGADLSAFENDGDAIKALVEASQRATALEKMQPYVQDYLQNQAEYQRFRQQPQQPPQAPVAPPAGEDEPPKFWNGPEWNPQWLSMVRKDEETGQLLPDYAAGGTPEVAQKVQSFIQYRQDQQEQFWTDPFKYIEKFVDHRADERARELVQTELQRHGEQQEARQFISANREWLLQHDAQGQLQTNPATGAPVLSNEGNVFMQHLQEGTEQHGLSAQAAQNYALKMLEASRAMASAAAGNGADARDAQSKVDFLQRAAGFNPSQAASTNRKADAKGDAPPQDTTLSLEELMRRNLKEAGITDEDIASSH